MLFASASRIPLGYFFLSALTLIHTSNLIPHCDTRDGVDGLLDFVLLQYFEKNSPFEDSLNVLYEMR